MADRTVYGSNQSAQAGGGTATFQPSGIIDVDTTQAAVTDGTLQTLRSYTLPANTLDAVGRAIRITVFGTTAANNNSKVINLVFGGTTVASLSHAANNDTFRLTCDIIKSGANTQKCSGWAFYSELNDNTSTAWAAETAFYNSTSATDTSDITILVQGDGVAASDIVYEGMIVEYLS